MDNNGKNYSSDRSAPSDPSDLPPPPSDPAELRREKMMAFQLGALDDDEMALIRGRLESDPDWKKAAADAQAMLLGLSDDGPVRANVPGDLGGRTIQRIRTEVKGLRTEVQPRVSVAQSIRAVPQSSVLSPQSFRYVAAAIFFLCALPVGWLTLSYLWPAAGGESILWRADDKLAAGTPFAPYLIVRDARTQKPQSGVHLAAYLSSGGKSFPIGEGATDAMGVLAADGQAALRIPEVASGNYKLVIEARGGSGTVLDHVERDVLVTRSARLALSPDRTQARPGETIRARTLLVNNAGEKPLADQLVTIDLLDPAGNRIGRMEKRSTKFGLAWTEFPLDSAAPEGSYKLSAECNGMKSERIVEVKQYKLPPFQVKLTPAKPWFGSVDPVCGEIKAATFDGHPVANAKGNATLLNSNGANFGNAKIELDADGKGKFDLGAHPQLVSNDGRGGPTDLRLDVTLSDPAGRSASGESAIHICDQPVVITGVAEAGELVQGLKNKIYIIARTPDGKPAVTKLDVTSSWQKGADHIQTDAQGVAIYEIADPKMPAEVLDVRVPGALASSGISLPVRPESRGQLLVRTDKSIYRGGESVNFGAFVSPATKPIGPAMICLRQGGQTVATVAAEFVEDKDNPFNCKLHIPNGVGGVFELVATATIAPNVIWSDTRTILVSGSSGVHVVAAADKPNYKPGERAQLNFTVTDAGGAGVPAAVSVVGVDDALLALTGEHPGLAQALQAAGVNVFRQPNFPLNANAIAAEDGGKDVAHAALANVKSDEKAIVAADFIDTGAAKLAAANSAREKTAGTLKEWTLLLLILGCALFVIVRSWSDSTAAALSAVPMLTFLISGLGLFGVSVLYPNAGVFAIGGFALLLTSHIVLLYLSGARTDERIDNTVFGTATMLSDFGLGGLVLLALNASSYDIRTYAGVFVIGVLGALFLQLNFSRPEKQRVVSGLGLIGFGFAVLVLGFMLVPPILGRGKEAANRVTGVAPASKAFAEPVNAGGMQPHDAKTGKEMALPIEMLRPSAVPKAGFDFSVTDNLEAPAPHLRWDFPETMIFAPEVVTDETGHASFALDVADSLTSWKVETDAIALDGGTGCTQCSLVVTQAFSADLMLPTDVTEGDEITVSAIVSNHSGEEQNVELMLDVSGARALDRRESVRVGAKSVASTEFKVRFDRVGTAKLSLTATAEHHGESDRVLREVTVIPAGQPIAFNASSLIQADGDLDVLVPENALPGTISAALHIHRGPLTQMIEGLDSMLREPNGCFEQTSSTTYPNIMILRYMRANGISKPDVEKRALDYIARGYQRLLGFEVPGTKGGFSLFGQAPASTWLTAYGLMEFTDMSAVYPVDPAVLERMRTYLRSQLNPDGSFKVDPFQCHERAPAGIAGSAYIVMAMGKFAPPEAVRYLREHARESELEPYLCSISANALLIDDRATAGQLAGKLRGLATVVNKTASLAAQRTLAWAHGDTAATESSALGALALLESGQDLDFAKDLLAGIQQRAGSQYGWGSTHATVLALRALERAASAVRKNGPSRVIVELNGQTLLPIDLPAEETAVPVVLPVTLPAGKSHLKIKVNGVPVVVSVVGKAYEPWSDKTHGRDGHATNPTLGASITYDSLKVKQGVSVLGTLSINSGAHAEVPMAEWGVPAGFEPDAGDLNALKAKGTISRWEMSGRKVRIYLPDMNAGQKLSLNVRFYANSKGQLSSPTGRVYEYYRGSEAVTLAPAKFDVW